MRNALVTVCLTIGPLLLLPAAGSSKTPPAGRRSEVSRSKRTAKKGTKKAHRPRRVRRRARRHSRARCRSIFCTAQVLRLDGSSKGSTQLTQAQVERVMQSSRTRLEPCLVEARRRDPEMLKAFIEFVVHRSGRVLASRVNGKQRTVLARCISRKMRTVRFPRTGTPRIVASFTLAVPQ